MHADLSVALPTQPTQPPSNPALTPGLLVCPLTWQTRQPWRPLGHSQNTPCRRRMWTAAFWSR